MQAASVLKIRITSVLVSSLLLLAADCKQEPAIPIDVATFRCNEKTQKEFNQKRLQAEGYLSPGAFWNCDQARRGCTMRLGATIDWDGYSRGNDLLVYAALETGANSMDRMGDDFAVNQLKFRDRAGKELTHKDKVRVVGRAIFWTHPDNKEIMCYLEGPVDIESIPAT